MNLKTRSKYKEKNKKPEKLEDSTAMDPQVNQQRKSTIALIAFFAAVFGVFVGVLLATGLDWIPHSIAQTQKRDSSVEPSDFLLRTQESFRDLVAAVRPAVVSIEAKGVQPVQSFEFFEFPDPFRDFFEFPWPFGDPNQQRQQQRQERQKTYPRTLSAGSGFIVDPKGYILTNNHVVSGATELKVQLDDGRKFTAEIVGTDPETDVAVLKISDTKSFPYMKLGDSDKLQVGDWVMAIGNPFGNLAGTVTVGIVSARNRERLQLPGNTTYQDFIQTDAAINLGNSGGPLVDIYGRAVGLNTAITAQGSGIGFAIPINLAKFVYESIIDTGEVVRSWIGVTIQDIDDDLAKTFNLEDSHGALISDVVKGDPADKAGLKAGDIILEVAGTRVISSQSASRTIAALPVGKPAEFLIMRDGKEMKITVTPAKRGKGPMKAEEDSKTKKTQKDDENPAENYLGMSVISLSDPSASQYDVPSDIQGVLVRSVEVGSPAFEKGIREGMVIGAINREDIKSIADYNRLMAKAKSEWQSNKKTVLLKVHVPTQDRWMTQFIALPFE